MSCRRCAAVHSTYRLGGHPVRDVRLERLDDLLRVVHAHLDVAAKVQRGPKAIGRRIGWKRHQLQDTVTTSVGIGTRVLTRYCLSTLSQWR